jgi:hypothetical protein
MLANVLPRQSVSPAINSSIFSDGFMDLHASNSGPASRGYHQANAYKKALATEGFQTNYGI